MVDAAVIRSHHRRCMLMSAGFVGRFIGVVDTMSASNCTTVTCPLAQSEERIHGKEKSEAILLVQ
jgi:hypothetical protein